MKHNPFKGGMIKSEFDFESLTRVASIVNSFGVNEALRPVLRGPTRDDTAAIIGSILLAETFIKHFQFVIQVKHEKVPRLP